MSATTARPSTATVLGSLARTSWKRLARGKALWVAGAIAALPLVFAYALRGRDHVIGETFFIERLVLAIVAPMLVGAAIGEDLDDRTATYLWSRPLARWTIVVGKLLANAPIAAVMVCTLYYVAIDVAAGHPPAWNMTVALGAATLAVATVSAALAALLPRLAMALSIVYVLFDVMIGELPASVAQLSITHHARELANLQTADDVTTSVVALVAIPALWLAIGLWRVRKLEM